MIKEKRLGWGHILRMKKKIMNLIDKKKRKRWGRKIKKKVRTKIKIKKMKKKDWPRDKWLLLRCDPQKQTRMAFKLDIRQTTSQRRLLISGSQSEHIDFFAHIFLATFLVADTQFYKRLCPSVRWSVRSGDRVEKWKNERFGYFLCMFVYGVGFGVWIGVGCPCPPVRNDIVTPRHLFHVQSNPAPRWSVVIETKRGKQAF